MSSYITLANPQSIVAGLCLHLQQCAGADLSVKFPSVLVCVCCEYCLAGSNVDDGVQKKGGADSLYHHWLPWNQGGCDFCGYGDSLQTPYIQFFFFG